VAQALTPPFLLAAVVLGVAAAAKLRSPAAAARALAVLGLPASPGLVRLFAACEGMLGLWCLAFPSRVAAGVMGSLYAVFAGLVLLLARRQASCGCFGEGDAPASIVQTILSAVLSIVAFAGLLSVPHGLPWLLERPPGYAALLIAGIAGSVYGAVLAYTEMPHAWGSWGAR
jgi:hypothetical protein